MKKAITKTVAAVERERERERESLNLTNKKIRASYMLALGLRINDR